jgi:hypothetical protein
MRFPWNKPAFRQFLADFREGYSYVRDPLGWGNRIRSAQTEKFRPRPTAYQFQNGDIILHPAMEAAVRAKLHAHAVEAKNMFAALGIQVMVSELCLQEPPATGWPDVTVPELPRLRP